MTNTKNNGASRPSKTDRPSRPYSSLKSNATDHFLQYNCYTLLLLSHECN